MGRFGLGKVAVGLAVALPLLAAPVQGAPSPCRNTASFSAWLDQFKRDALAAGVTRRTVDQALSGITLDQRVIDADRRQRVFTQTFVQFAGRMVSSYRMQRGTKLIRDYSSTFRRIESQYGVPAPVLVAFWGLETDFGANIGNMQTIRSLASLAYDCRRPDQFREQLVAALKIIDRGDLTASQMVGPWAGELGQTQFLPSHYLESGVDFDGDGRRDLLRSAPDALASAANLLAKTGWRRGEPWLEEVRVPGQLPWDQAALTIKHPRSQWARWGITKANGRRLSSDAMPASLLLPMGRDGPAFLAYRNFDVYLEWNQSLVYATTAAYFATRLAGAPPVSGGRGKVAALTFEQTRELQRLLSGAGYDTGGIDGIIGEKTRRAVRSVQGKLGLPADGYPTPEVLARLRRM